MWTLAADFTLRLVELLVITRAILRPHRDPASRIAWVVVIAVVPIGGIVAYLLFGETSIGRRHVARSSAVLASMPPVAVALQEDETRSGPSLPERVAPLFRMGESINGFAPMGGNSARLTEDSNAAIDDIVADMDAASDQIHLCFYIWLADVNGLKVVEALKRAAERGVTCRAMADGLGSRAMIASRYWKQMRDAGVHVAVALPIGNPFGRLLNGRIDLRNHRKLVVIDDAVTYCGSQNCADPEFRVKAKYAPWVDVLVRFEGPVARQNQHVFVGDWMTWVDEDLRDLLSAPLRGPAGGTADPGFTAQVIATGPTLRNSAMPDVFEAVMHAAQRRLIITTPYYVPNESMQAALCAAAHRGVDTLIVLPARNDSFIIGAASRSYYQELLSAGVQIHQYVGGLLHAKSITVDDDVTLIGSANMDRRSFDLNEENNILLHDAALTASMRARQQAYLERSQPVTLEEVESWTTGRRLWNNTLGMLGPLL